SGTVMWIHPPMILHKKSSEIQILLPLTSMEKLLLKNIIDIFTQECPKMLLGNSLVDPKVGFIFLS
ncbi:hypothetical protein ACJX0J_040638, partial [Zea mays]